MIDCRLLRPLIRCMLSSGSDDRIACQLTAFYLSFKSIPAKSAMNSTCSLLLSIAQFMSERCEQRKGGLRGHTIPGGNRIFDGRLGSPSVSILQRYRVRTKEWDPGLVKFFPAVEYHFCLSLPVKFPQPRFHSF